MEIHNLASTPLPPKKKSSYLDDFSEEREASLKSTLDSASLVEGKSSPLLTKNHKCDNLNTDARETAKLFEVTEIKEALRDRNRVNVFISGVYDFSLDISQVVDYKLKVGKFLSREELETLRSASAFGKLYNSTLEWVLMRPRSVKETRDYLTRRKYKRLADNKSRALASDYKKTHKSENPYKNPENLDSRGRLKFKNSPWAKSTNPLPEISDDIIEKVMNRLLERGYLDDLKYAKYFVENRKVTKGTSLRRLEQELSVKGISRSFISEALASTSRDDTEEIKKIINKKRKKYNDSKLVNYLVHQGFDYELVKSLVFEESE